MDLKGKKVLLAGGTGLIGSHLIGLLKDEGVEISLLSRSSGEHKGIKAYEWSTVDETMDESALDGVDYIINLAGAGIADKRWTDSRKKVIIESREKSAAVIKKYLIKTGVKPKCYLSASAVDYYGDRGEERLTEDSPPGTGFLTEAVQKWERAADELASITTVKKLRIGLVLSARGGALPSMAGPQKFGLGALLGGGKQFYPWVHIEDVARMMIFLLKNEEQKGVFNGVSPEPITQRDMVDAIAKGMGRPALKFPVPAFALRLALGEMSDLVLNSRKVVPERMEKEGYEFKFTDATEALRDLAERKV
nr:TIGR01777 family oxidoreductase [Saprospiraceae bacterium]